MSYRDAARPIAERVDDLLGQMTLDEKLAQLASRWASELTDGSGVSLDKMRQLLPHGIGQITRIGGSSILEPLESAKAANAIQRFLVENTRLGIPAVVHEECCAGYMALGGTVFPQIIGVASTFEPALAEKMTSVIRSQMRAVGAHQGLAPVLDVARDPRWGRCEETFGEDPILAACFGTAYVRGLQGDSLKNGGVMATGKHFVGHSLSQAGQNCAPVHMGPRELWEVYLAPFQAVIRDAGLHSIMNAYPELDGEVVAASRRILTDLLRGRLGFAGLVVSDYEAIQMIHNYHRMVGDTTEAAALALQAGIDVELPAATCYGGPLRAALESGRIGTEAVDVAVARHLQKKFELGLFESPYVDEGKVTEVFETADQRDLAREIAAKSLVLLKNDGLLPLRKDVKTLAVIGPNAADSRSLVGDYSFAAQFELRAINPAPGDGAASRGPKAIEGKGVRVPDILEAIRQALPKTKVLHARGCDNLDPDTSGFQEAVQAASKAEAVVLVLGDRSGLAPDSTCGETRDSADLLLPGAQEALFREIAATGKPIAVVLITGRPLAINGVAEQAAAVLEAWLPGEEGGPAVAAALLGDLNPGGRLPMTFPRHVGQVPIFYSHKPSGARSNWYIDYVSVEASPLYPFGHGLSYTSFEYGQFALDRERAAAGETVAVSATIKNTGQRPGDEVVQLYVCDEQASCPRPVKELKGFVRLGLEPGESRRVTFHLAVDQLAFYDENLELVVEGGKVRIMLGSSSADVRLEASFEIAGPGKTCVAKRLFTCPVEIE
jgi:beta-glucosidase